MPSDETPWVVKGVSQDVRKAVKKFAVESDFTMAEALEWMVLGGTVTIAIDLPEIVVQVLSTRRDKKKMADPKLREDFEKFMQRVVSEAAVNWLERRHGIEIAIPLEESEEAGGAGVDAAEKDE